MVQPEARGQPDRPQCGSVTWQTTHVGYRYDALAPDGSEIRELVRVDGASMVHCTLRPGQVSRAMRHRTVEEVWFCVAGSGELWRRSGETEEVVQLSADSAVTIPLRTEFQFRANGDRALELIIATLPPWPGADEAEPVVGHWEPAK